jgi:hypothetical protein
MRCGAGSGEVDVSVLSPRPLPGRAEVCEPRGAEATSTPSQLEQPASRGLAPVDLLAHEVVWS